MSAGVLYVVVDEKYFEEACCSASSLRRVMPGLPVTLFTGLDRTSECFDDIILLDSPGVGVDDKIVCMSNSPYDYTLFLDADTYVCAEIPEFFTVLENFDITIAHSLDRVNYTINDIPDSFCGLNSGVIAYRRNRRVSDFFRDWLRLYEQLAQDPGLKLRNEPSLHPALYHSKLRLAILPMKYNCRIHKMGHLQGEAKILHAHVLPSRWADVARAVNRVLGDRIFVQGKIFAVDNDSLELLADLSHWLA